MTTAEAADAFLAHFGKLKPDSVPTAAHMLVNNERHVKALKMIAIGMDGKKKLRIIVDYDPEFPSIAVDMFNLL